MATTSQSGTQAGRSTTRTQRAESPRSTERAHGATVNLPFVTAEFRRPDVHLPDLRLPGREDVEGVVTTVRENLPPREQMAYYGGLGLLAALSVIEWPVAAAIGVGTMVAQRAGGGTSPSRSTSSQGRSRSTATG
jgi:hypothetical protein